MSRAHQLHLEERRRRNLRWLMPLCPSFSDLWHVLVVRLSNYMLPSNYVLPSNQGSLLLILRGGCLLLKYSNFQQIIKISANFIKSSFKVQKDRIILEPLTHILGQYTTDP